MEATANNRLSIAASNVWQARFPEHEDYPDYSGDCGDIIADGNRRWLLRIVREAGYRNPAEYNQDLRSRMVSDDGTMSIKVSDLLMSLEIEDVCDDCGEAYEVIHHRGGFDGGMTFYECPGCGKREC